MSKHSIVLSVFFASIAVMATPAANAADAKAAGELAERIRMVHERFEKGVMPAFTDDFILADVALRPDYPRRFANYSGDVSGRYIGAVALLPVTSSCALAGLVNDILKNQRADGRFGAESLNYTPAEIGPEHMALLWGNGRLLTGLMEYYTKTNDLTALDSARRNADFILSVRDACSQPEVTERLRGKAASGYICFTQVIEGLVMLYQATNDTRYLDGADQIAAWFQREREKQHTHGYLTTLRGIMMLHAVTGKAEYLETARGAYDDLVKAGEMLVFGGMPEYFTNPNNSDEGCSVADFLRLSLQLWQATGEMQYLDRAEFCLLNHMYGNQFDTGDFGHHALTQWGYGPREGAGRAWWCCTMHGLRAFRDVLDDALELKDSGFRANLFLDLDWSDGPWQVQVRRTAEGAEVSILQAAPDTSMVAVRQSSWAGPLALAVNGTAVAGEAAAGYLEVRRAWKAGDVLSVRMPMQARLLKRDGSTVLPAALGSDPVEAVLLYGPWLLGVDATFDPMFLGEPWQGNVISLPQALKADMPGATSAPLEVPGAHFTVSYIHDGFPEPCTVTLRPFSEQTAHDQNAFTVWLKYRAAR